jgi:hypothetical protein
MNLLAIFHHQYLHSIISQLLNLEFEDCTGGSYIFPPMATAITLTMLGCFKERRREISLIAVMGVPSRLSEESILIVLSATISPERRSRARLGHMSEFITARWYILDYSEC